MVSSLCAVTAGAIQMSLGLGGFSGHDTCEGEKLASRMERVSVRVEVAQPRMLRVHIWDNVCWSPGDRVQSGSDQNVKKAGQKVGLG